MKINFPHYYNVLLFGPPGVGKFDFILNYTAISLKASEKVVFITTDNSVENIEERMNRLGINLPDYYEKEFAFIDCYSATCGKSNERWFCLTSMSNLEDLSLGIAQTSRRLGPPVRILFDSLSTLYLHNSISTMASFFQIVVRRIKSEYGFSLHTVEKGMHDTQTEATLYHLVDGVLEMKFDENMERYIRVHHMKGKPALRPKWVKINFEENGEMVLSEDLF